MNMMAKVQTVHVAYKGTGPAAISVITGETVMAFGSGPSVAPHVHAKRLRAIATTGRKRSTPHVPTMSETLPDYEVMQWYGVLVPAGTPQGAIARLSEASVKVLADRDLKERLLAQGIEAAAGGVDEFSAYFPAELRKWAKVIQDVGVKPQ